MRTVIILYPCPCCPTWNVDEWVYLEKLEGEGDTKPKITKHNHCNEFPTIDSARYHYRPILGELIESIYDPKTDSCSNPDNPLANFVVQGSHGRCHACRAIAGAKEWLAVEGTRTAEFEELPIDKLRRERDDANELEE